MAANRSPHETSNPDVGHVRYARTQFLFFRRHLSKCLTRRRRTASLLSPSDELFEIIRSRQLRTAGAGKQLDQRRWRKPTTNPLLPLRPNRHPKRDKTPTEWGIIHSSQKKPLLFLHCLI